MVQLGYRHPFYWRGEAGQDLTGLRKQAVLKVPAVKEVSECPHGTRM